MIPILHLFLNCFVDKLLDFSDDNQFVAVLRNEAVVVPVVVVVVVVADVVVLLKNSRLRRLR